VTAETADQASPGEASFRLLAEHLPDLVIFAFDTDLRIWAATGGGIPARGWTSEEFLSMTVPEIAGAGRATDIRACCEGALAGRRTQLEMAGYDPPDRLWSLHFVPLSGGGPRGGMVLCRDVTEPRRAEELLRASQRRLAGAQRIAQVGSWEWDLETDALTASDELCRLFGLARGEGMVDEDGRLVRFIGTDQDITDRRRADAERRRLLNRVYEAQEGQDRRLATDLHDGHVQSLAAIGFKLEQARLRLGASGSPEVDELLWQVTKDLSAEVTALRRTIGRLRPLVLVEDGLEAALREEAKSACNRTALANCEVISELVTRLDPVVETALFRVAQQALANVVEHASATHAEVIIECGAKGMLLRVSDDGCGFDPDHVQVIADIAHFGLIAMRERVEALGGRFRVTTAPGQGTVVEARLPLAVAAEGPGA
jgi:signal transduction histidine kinase